MSTDSGGATTVAKAEISAGGIVPIGFIKTAGNVIFIPYFDEAYDLWLFPTEAEADANDTSNAIQVADDMSFFTDSDIFTTSTENLAIVFTNYADLVSGTLPDGSSITLTAGQNVRILGRVTEGDGGQNDYLIGTFGTADVGSIVDLGSGLQAKGLFPGEDLFFEQFGALGDGVDDTTAITNTLAFSQGKRIKGINGKTYISTVGQPMLASTILNLGGATLKFTGSSGVKDLEPATGCEVYNGTIEEAGSTHSGSGETHCPVSIGNFQTGTGVSNVSVHDLTLISNKPDGVLCGVWGGSNGIEVYNIIAPTSSTVNSVIECHWGGQAASDAVQHPHNVTIDNIRCDGMTSTTVGGAMVFLSSVYNIAVSNIRGDDVIRGVVVSAGDWGDDYSISSQKGLIGKNITLDNALITECFKTGLQIDGFTSFGLTEAGHTGVTGDTTVASPNMTNVSSTSKLFVGRVINVAGAGEFQIRGISGTTVVLDRDAGALLTGAAVTAGAWPMEVKVTNSVFRCDGSGTVVGPLTMQATSGGRFENVELSGGLTHGVNILDWVNDNEFSGGHIHDNQNNGVDENRAGKSNNNTFDGVKFTRNNLAAGTGRTDSCSILFSSSNNKAINCNFGQYSQETAYIHVSVETTARNTEITGNKFLGVVNTGFALRNGAAGNVEDHDTRTLFADNTIDSSVTPLYKVSGGTPPIARKWLNPIQNTENVRWSNNFAPTAGTHSQGDEVDQSSPAVGSPIGWTCTVSGTPGTWVAWANL
jgi:hypothetical protein